jgi:molybdate transport system ATP-binding protein
VNTWSAAEAAVTRLELSCWLRYPSGFVLDVSFSTGAELTLLAGPSGSGKTSTLSILAGLRRPSRGFIRHGADVLFDSAAGIHVPPEKRRIGYVFQDHLLFPHLTVRSNLLYGWKRRPPQAQPPGLAKVVEVLELDGLLDRLPYTLSGGQRQRVALGRALLCGPRLLLLDEPLAAVDEGLRQRVLVYVEEVLKQWNIPILYVTHNVGEAERLAGQIVYLEHGKVVRIEERGSAALPPR